MPLRLENRSFEKGDIVVYILLFSPARGVGLILGGTQGHPTEQEDGFYCSTMGTLPWGGGCASAPPRSLQASGGSG